MSAMHGWPWCREQSTTALPSGTLAHKFYPTWDKQKIVTLKNTSLDPLLVHHSIVSCPLPRQLPLLNATTPLLFAIPPDQALDYFTSAHATRAARADARTSRTRWPQAAARCLSTEGT